jgi:uncharacterized OsmC-like protein
MEEKEVTIELEQTKAMEFLVKFDSGGRTLIMDEPEPIGANNGPNAAKVLSAAIGNCLTASLFFCLQKARIDMGPFKTKVTTSILRGEKGRLRLGDSKVRITADVEPDAQNRMERCLGLFEDFCIVTASVRKGIDVAVEVVDNSGTVLFDSKERE